jgi:hypothetical protein
MKNPIGIKNDDYDAHDDELQWFFKGGAVLSLQR